MAPLSSIARRLARTKFGQKSLTQSDGLGILKEKPTARVYGGLALMALSYLAGLPTLAFLSYLSVKMSDDNCCWRSRCFRIGTHYVRSGRLSGREELRYEGAALGDQTISGKIRLIEVFHW